MAHKCQNTLFWRHFILTEKCDHISRVDSVTCPLWCQEVEVLNFLFEGFDILVDRIWRYTPNLDQPIMLDEYCFTGQVAVDDWRVTAEEILLDTDLFSQIQ